MPPSGTPLLEARDLWAVPRGAAPGSEAVVRGVDLAVHPGERIALMGPNGSGKSTLALALAGLERPRRGLVRGPGRGRVGLLRQSPEDQFLTLSVAREVGLGLEFRGWDAPSRVESALARFGLTELRSRPPHQLSGGEKQRVALAAFFALEPALLILDEPTSYLDDDGRAGLLRALGELPAPTAVLFVTPRLEEARHAGRVLLMDGGRIVADGAAEDVLRDRERLLALRLDAPPVPRPAAPEGRGGHRLRARGVRAVYRGAGGERAVLHDVDLELAAGEVVGLLGPAGSGKSTLVAVLAGLHPCAAGEVTLDGEPPPAVAAEDWWRMSLRQWWRARGGDGRPCAHPGDARERARVAVLFASPEEQNVSRTMLEDVAYGLVRRGVEPARASARAAAALADLGFEEDRSRGPVVSLSFGERRLASLAGVLVLEPDFLLLDEPTVGLDAVNRRQVAESIVACAARGCGILLATHDRGWADSICGRVVSLVEGRIEEHP